ncbi:hypothetical protein [Dyadobacter alkalitolerans]|uniref:hypothetical protein n=1 Tax=Dyadobacter alkalitolerans TaxID=492736 RepID=UPI00040AAADC|nr:hypothetical protein [Dyadobacter alkalitolerans]
MKDRERINILEELMAENLIRLDRLDNGQDELKRGQILLQESMLDLTKVVRKNSTDIEYLKENMSTKQGLANLFEVMMDRFDRTDKQFAEMRQDIGMLKAR